eukprot:3940030-Rhodomonas_salina.2
MTERRRDQKVYHHAWYRHTRALSTTLCPLPVPPYASSQYRYTRARYQHSKRVEPCYCGTCAALRKQRACAQADSTMRCAITGECQGRGHAHQETDPPKHTVGKAGIGSIARTLPWFPSKKAPKRSSTRVTFHLAAPNSIISVPHTETRLAAS